VYAEDVYPTGQVVNEQDRQVRRPAEEISERIGVLPPPRGGFAVRWMMSILILAMFAWTNFAPQAAWADLDADRLKKRIG
jgi:hypothetical protein